METVSHLLFFQAQQNTPRAYAANRFEVQLGIILPNLVLLPPLYRFLKTKTANAYYSGWDTAENSNFGTLVAAKMPYLFKSHNSKVSSQGATGDRSGGGSGGRSRRRSSGNANTPRKFSFGRKFSAGQQEGRKASEKMRFAMQTIGGGERRSKGTATDEDFALTGDERNGGGFPIKERKQKEHKGMKALMGRDAKYLTSDFSKMSSKGAPDDGDDLGSRWDFSFPPQGEGGQDQMRVANGGGGQGNAHRDDIEDAFASRTTDITWAGTGGKDRGAGRDSQDLPASPKQRPQKPNTAGRGEHDSWPLSQVGMQPSPDNEAIVKTTTTTMKPSALGEGQDIGTTTTCHGEPVQGARPDRGNSKGTGFMNMIGRGGRKDRGSSPYGGDAQRRYRHTSSEDIILPLQGSQYEEECVEEEDEYDSPRSGSDDVRR